MRDDSLTLRIVVLAVLLPSAAAAGVTALVATRTLHPGVGQMVAAGGAILIVAVLAAALSAFSPKYRPTPLLTPLFAGIFAALLATTTIYALHAHVASKRVVAEAVQPKAKAPVHPAKTAAIVAKAAVEPIAGPERTSMEPGFDSGAFAEPPKPKVQDQLQAVAPPPAEAQDQAQAEAQPLPDDAADNDAMGGPLVKVANAVVPAANAAEKRNVSGIERKPAVAVARIPVPAAAPRPGVNAPINLAVSFDPSGPSMPAAEGPPIPLDPTDEAVGTAQAHASIPPLPRIRPCGAGGQTCP